jgi:hypothetical protein
MKINFIVSTLLSIGLLSCSKSSNPVEPIASTSILGSIGSQRNYLITESWFIQGTNTPYVVVAESLVSRIDLIDSLRLLGVVQITEETEIVAPLDSSFYTSWHLPLPKTNYKMTNGNGPRYSLPEQVQALSSGLSYREGSMFEQNVWLETSDELQSVLPVNDWKISPPLPWVKKPFQINESWIRSQFIDTSKNQVLQQKNIKVMGQEYITVKAGRFLAYKLAIYWSDGSPASAYEFEYYVPNYGLVLYTFDCPVSIATIKPNGGGSTTISVRQVIRKELSSANVLP